MKRRGFLSAALVGLTAKGERRIAGGFVNEAQELGHRLRDGAAFPAAREQRRVAVVIVGGGIAGLSAAWRLEKRGFRDFVLLEMEAVAGGNARHGENEVSAYPWAAHYVPPPGREARSVRELFEELGLYEDGAPTERHLVHSPQERLFLHGRWQEGLEPATGLAARDREQYKRFADLVEGYRKSAAFRIPVDEGRGSEELDRVSMSAWMDSKRLDSPYLRWYVDYSCRDDYGAAVGETSAWAGIHYFAARPEEDEGPFTWPEGNGWIVKKLLARLGRHVETGTPVYRVERRGRRLLVRTPQADLLADAVIWAAPTFLAHYLVEGEPKAEGFEYSPWVTANLTLDRPPKERGGAPPAWDNVMYGSPSLGYVVATHQNVTTHAGRTVWTYYWALAHGAPAQVRRELLAERWDAWRDRILSDLERVHPDLRECVSRVDVMRMGHAMIRPSVGFRGSPARARFAGLRGALVYANSDLSGISIFEEAQYRGVVAADRVLDNLGRSRSS
ncbi:MAG: FAD-dependent oxidoreductase [Bryobacteraceae bacterium]|nr:FAD-dependent oxidoreductase [Bryobacteraceae bacterium]